VLVCALEHGLTPSRRKRLIESLDLWPQTLHRLRQWWLLHFTLTPCWRCVQPQFLPPINAQRLPGSLLARLDGADLHRRVMQLLALLQPLTSVSCSRYLPLNPGPQKMR